jgi:hypothetical protein
MERGGLVGSARRVNIMVVRKNSRYFEIVERSHCSLTFSKLVAAVKRLSVHHCQQQCHDRQRRGCEGGGGSTIVGDERANER